MNHYINLFENWVNKYKIPIQCGNDYDEVLKKWDENEKYIQEINEQNLPFVLGHNQFSGMNIDEYLEHLKQNAEFGKKIKKRDRQQNYKHYKNDDLPKYVNWVEAGAVTQVEDQGSCGSCWTFSATGALEGAYFIKTGKLISFSKQQLIDCDNLFYGGKNYGCNGGLMNHAFEWIISNGGLSSETDYPYVSGDDCDDDNCNNTCKIDSKKLKIVK